MEEIVGLIFCIALFFGFYYVIDKIHQSKQHTMQYEFDLNNEKEVALFFVNRELDLINKEIEHHNDMITAMQDIVIKESAMLSYSQMDNYNMSIGFRQKRIFLLMEERDFLEKKKLVILKQK